MKRIFFAFIAVVMMTSCQNGILLNKVLNEYKKDKTEQDDTPPTVVEDSTTIVKDPVVSVSFINDMAVLTIDSVTLNLIKVEKGTFQMGSADGTGHSKPVHEVTLTQDYYIGETVVTQKLWQAFMRSNPSSTNAIGDNYPVNLINWDNCKTFIRKLNEVSGHTFALPTEAQWEFAARGGNKSKGYVYSGGNNIGEVAWYSENSTALHQVATKKANELGLYDMSGNVYEWCEDYYHDYTSSAETDPSYSSSSQSKKIMRGGSYSTDESSCLSTCRNWGYYYSAFINVGMRLVLLY